MTKSIIIHGHYYQPPRANPATGVIPIETSAAPFPNWNARIADECYRPNTRAAILDSNDHGTVAEQLNTYAFTSFNFGPTLLRWMEDSTPDIYQAILAADRDSARRLGTGNAIAQSMHHTILPLAAPRDRQTEIRWGLDDFEHRFGRPTRGMWLPECAVDLATLDAVARAGVEFVILAPRQCRASRSIGGGWRYEAVDTGVPYQVQLPSGASLVAFFYDGPLSQSIAFSGLLDDGAKFARHLAGSRETGLVNVATDGETYGHHHHHGEMALAFALRTLLDDRSVSVTNYAAYLDENPPRHQAIIVDPSSWSCAHGVERWRSDCSCAIGTSQPGDQAWRTPLRDSLNWLRTELVGWYAEQARDVGANPWSLRNGYHGASLRGPESVAAYVRSEGVTGDIKPVVEILEMQRVMLTMFTSCGWFFDSPDDIATRLDIMAATEAARRFERLSGREVRQELARRMRGVEGAEDLILPECACPV
ncbi:MAG: alpha-amylase/alpha-mannosidase (GH57 family) [Bradymonadia bacterium]